ncbi:MAG: DMT family transporter [Beijerinckiaceae bacterium]|nr:DMT family transporter [Beijerinckiaceae bacterium]MCI0735070.1 DMT family transporter [Beijerinckiaceae bacterium]
MTRTLQAAAQSSGDNSASKEFAASKKPSLASGSAARTGIPWMLAATCLFVCQDSTARVLVQTYPATEIAFVRYFVHIVLAGLYIAWRNPRLAISHRPLLQILRSSFLLGATLFVILALKFMPLVDVCAIVWVAPVLVTAFSAFLLHEKVTPAAWASVLAGLIGVWAIIGRTGLEFSFSMLFPLIAALSNALYQITTRLLHNADSPPTTLFYTAVAGALFCGGFLPFAATVPTAAGGALMLFLGLAGLASHFCLIRAFAVAPANIIAPFGYTSLLWAALFSILIFGEIPGSHTILGAGLIAGSGLFIFLHGRKT